MKKYSSHYRGTIYDLGSGESPYKDFFLQYAQQYIAVDWASSIHHTKADIIADLNERLPIPSGVADTILSISVMEHLREPETMLHEAFRILTPNGSMVMQVPWQWRIHESPYDYFRYTPYGLKYLLNKAGFVDIKIEPQSGFFSMSILKFNYFTLRLIKGSRVKRLFLRAIFTPIWYLNQKVAPHLDKLDKDWEIESSGYFVTARKP